MSKSSRSGPRENGTSDEGFPRAIIHKKILDEARESPQVPVEEIAARVGGASAELVERVLDDYGDPADTEEKGSGVKDSAVNHPVEAGTSESNTDHVTPVEPVETDRDLSAKQRRTLLAIYNNPEATQAEIAKKLDVTNTAVSHRVRGIDGFDWDGRDQFVREFFDGRMEATSLGTPDGKADRRRDVPEEELVERVDDISERIDMLERRVRERFDDTRDAVIGDELAVKMIHACIRSDALTADEELEIVRAVISTVESVD